MTQEITFTGQSRIDVVMAEDASQLDEIVLIGYGSTTKQDATGAVEKVSDEEFNRGAIVAPQQLIAGKAAGVTIRQSVSGPTGGVDINIRGNSALEFESSTRPLIVVDGENTNLELSARNLPFIKVLRAEGVNVYDILKYPNLVLTEAAVDQIEGVLAK